MSFVADSGGRGLGATSDAAAAPQRARGRSVKPLLALMPFVARYRGRVVAAIAALFVASLATLAVPLAIRRMIDFGFSAERVGLIDQYFS